MPVRPGRVGRSAGWSPRPVAVRVVLQFEFGGLVVGVLLGQAGAALPVEGVVPDHPVVVAVAAAHVEPSHHDHRVASIETLFYWGKGMDRSSDRRLTYRLRPRQEPPQPRGVGPHRRPAGPVRLREERQTPTHQPPQWRAPNPTCPEGSQTPSSKPKRSWPRPALRSPQAFPSPSWSPIVGRRALCATPALRAGDRGGSLLGAALISSLRSAPVPGTGSWHSSRSTARDLPCQEGAENGR
jgi:hypothetical protein